MTSQDQQGDVSEGQQASASEILRPLPMKGNDDGAVQLGPQLGE